MTNGMGREVSWFLAGALLGSAAVALTTPWSGRRARTLVRRKIEGGGEQLAEATKGIRRKGEELRSGSERIVRGTKRMFG
jgi:gas vesicle protein